MALDRYVEINVRVQSGDPVAAVLAASGESLASYSAASYEWMEWFDQDPGLALYFRLRVQKGVAEATGRSPREPGVYGPGNLVRGRRCHACGGLKVTRPTTAYVYCDYCATLYDYDPRVAVDDPRALDPALVDRALEGVTAAPLARAFADGDREAYERITRWQSEVSTEICPAAYSPRIRDPAYRRALIDGVIVPWAVATRFDPAARELGARVGGAQRRALHRPDLPAVLDLLSCSRALWQVEGELLERVGVFAAHPDRLDPGLYLYLNASTFVRPWLALLGAADQTALLEAAGVACDYVAVPAIEFADLGCGQCGQRLPVPIGAVRCVCESCGFVLDLAGRAFHCAGCGARVGLPAGAREARCGHCGARFAL
jgi:hypothetical protein